MNEATKQRIDAMITENPVMVFMKGDRYFPQCGFSGTVIQILENLGADYTTVDILADPDLRQGIKEYSSWPTIPQVYIKGQFIGGCDIMRELYSRGELPSLLEPVATK